MAMENLLNETEEKLLIGLLYNHVSFGTTLEVSGELNGAGIQRLNLLRGIFEKLLKKFSLDSKLSEENYLLLGMPNLIKRSSLKKWVREEENKHLQIRAKYFLAK